MPVGVHTPLPKYPSGDWQLLSRSRSRALQRTTTAFFHVGHSAWMSDETDAKKILTAFTWRTGGDHQDALVLRG